MLDHITATGGDVDAIHANYWLSGVAGHRLKHELDLPLVSTFHTLARVKAETGDPEPQRRIDAEAEVIGCSDAILASCTAEAAQLERLYGARPERIEIVPPGRRPRLLLARRPAAAPARRSASPPDRPVLLFVGRIQPLKGLDVAVAALAALPDQDAVLVVVGGPSGPTGEAELARVHELARDARRRGPGPLRAAPAPPPAVDLLPGRRRRASCRAGRSRSGWSPSRRRPAARPWWPPRSAGSRTLVERRRAPASSSRAATRPPSPPPIDEAARPTRRWPAAIGAAAAARARGYTWSTTAARLRRLYADLTASADCVDCALTASSVAVRPAMRPAGDRASELDALEGRIDGWLAEQLADEPGGRRRRPRRGRASAAGTCGCGASRRTPSRSGSRCASGRCTTRPT